MHMHVDARAAVQRPEAQLDASGAQGSLITAIGGTATAIGDSTATTGFIDNFVQNKGHISIVMGEATFLTSAYSAEPGNALAAAGTFLDISGADIGGNRGKSRRAHPSRIGSWEIWRSHVGKHQRILR